MSGSQSGGVVQTTLTIDDGEFRRQLDAAARLINGHVRAVEQANRATVAMGQQSERAAGQTRNYGHILGQAGFQVQDFAVQVQGGTSALTALSQQGSQLLGIFGTGGAIAGAILTVGILATQLVSLGQTTDDLAKSNEAWGKQLQSLQGLLETAADRAARLRREQILSGEAFALFQGQQAAYEAEQQGQRALRLEQQIAGLRGLNRRLTPDQRQQNASEIEALEQELQIARARGDVAASANREAARLLQQFRDQSERGGGADKGKPTTGGGGSGGGRADEELLQVWRTISRGLDETSAASDKAFDSYRNLVEGLDPAEAAAARYEDRLSTLRQALQLGAISRDEFNRGLQLSTRGLDSDMARLSSQTSDLASVGREFATVFSSAFDGLITQGGKFSDVLDRLGLGLARILERQFITKPLESALTSSLGQGGFLRGIVDSAGSALSGLLGFRADGGPVFAGSPYIVGEEGPELFVPNASGSIVPNHAMGGSTVYIDARGAEPGVEARIEQVLARRLPGISAYVRGDLSARVNRGGSDALTFGRRRGA